MADDQKCETSDSSTTGFPSAFLPLRMAGIGFWPNI